MFKKTSLMVLFACALSVNVIAQPTTSNTSNTAGMSATLHKNPWCGCCEEYARYLEQHQIKVTRIDYDDLTPIKKALGTDQAASCHTVELNGYVIEGHVPVAAIHKLLTEKPELNGISVPDMPLNSPGMGPEIPGSLRVLSIDKTGQIVGEFGKF